MANKTAKRVMVSILVVLSMIINLFSCVPAVAADTSTSSASFIGIDKTTLGHWNGVYGNDGYILFGYAATPNPENRIEVEKYTYDIIKKPAYIDLINGNMYEVNDGSRVKVEPGYKDDDDSVLDKPAGSSLSHKVEASICVGDPKDVDGSNIGGTRLFTFHLNDNKEHIFTVYSNKDMNWKYFAIKDLNGNELVPLFRGIDMTPQFGAGSTYISFKVKGSFIFEYAGGWEEGLQGIFFDTIFPPRGLNAEEQSTGSIKLTWSNVSSADNVLIERSSDGTTYNQIASIGGNLTQYIDNDSSLIPEHTYYYRIRYQVGTDYSPYTLPVSVKIKNAKTMAYYVGTDTVTKGHWEGKYGSDGYILLGYQVPPKYNEWYSDESKPELDLTLKPGYLDSYSYSNTCRHIFPPYTDGYYAMDKTLDRPSSSPGDKYKVYAEDSYDPDGKQTFTFYLNDYNEHIFSMYSLEMKNYTVQIQDLNGNVVAQHPVTAEIFREGAYISFLVKGSFKLVLSGDRYAGCSGFFFDSPLFDKPTGVSTTNLPNRQVKIQWTNQGNPDKVILERSTDNISYTEIAALDGSVTEYIDTNLIPSQEYFYRLRNIKGTKYSSATDPVSITIPAMTPTVLTMQNGDLRVNINENITVSAKFEKVNEDGSRTLLVGKIVTFKLQGLHVGDGVTVGQEIPEVMGTAVTNEQGIATLTYTCEYPGSYTVVATTEPDDIDELAGTTSASIKLDVIAPNEWVLSPVILKISDAVMPGKLFSINGYGLNKDTVDIAIERDTTGELPVNPPEGAVHPDIVQTDRNGFFVVARLPEDLLPGVYNVWVKNENGWSKCYKMNAARPLFMSDYEAFNGIDIEIVGRNFDQKEFGGTTQTKVRLNNDSGKIFTTTVKEVNPYKITFTVGNADLGDYFVEVSNDNGVNWSRLMSGQKLRVVAPGEDPLELGVAWAKDFNWSNQKNVVDYGANPNDKDDDTAAVQAAVDAAEQDGGGVVYFPNGEYYISTINLPSGVVLLGEDEYNTKLYYTGTGKNFIDSKATGSYDKVPELQGIARLSLLLSDPQIRPDAFMWLGEGWGASVGDKTLRKANRIFVTNVNIDYPTDTDRQNGSGRGLGLEFIAKERVLVKDNRFVGWHAQPFINYVSEYYILKNNYFEYTEGFVVGVSTYAFYENNHVKVDHYDGVSKESHGLFARSNAYVANNIVENCGDMYNNFNDGEPICVEVPNAVFNYGSVLKATSTSITVAPVKALIEPKLEFGYLAVLITDGRGVGQMRKVTNIDKYTITVDRPFDITPDTSSKFCLIAPNEDVTFYKNTVINNAKGIWLFGNAIDSVVADNISIDSEGIFMWSCRNGEGLAPGYFTRITRNTIIGISKRSLHAGIGFNTERGDKPYYNEIAVYSTEITNNRICGDSSAVPSRRTEAPPLSGIFAASATYSSQYDGQGSGDSTNTIIEDNVLKNLQTGISLTHSTYGQVVSGNRYESTVLTFMDDTGSENTLVTDNTLIAAPAADFVRAATSTDGKKILVTFDKEIATLSAAPAGFTVTVAGGNAVGVTAVALNATDHRVVELTLADTIFTDTTDIKVAYTAGSVTSVDGGLLASFDAQNVTNNSIIVKSNMISTPTTIKVAPSTVTLNVGDTRVVAATVYDQNGNVMDGVNVVWSSDNPSIATVDNTGKITAVKAGTTVVKATYGNISGAVNVTVKEPGIPPSPPSDIQPVDDAKVDQAIERSKDSGQIIIDEPSDKPAIALMPTQLQKIKDIGKPLAVVVQGVKLVLPPEVIADMADMTAAQIEFKAAPLAQEEARQMMDQASNSSGLRMTQAFEFKIEAVAFNRQEISQFNDTVTVVIPVPEAAKRLASLGRMAVYNYNEGNKTWEPIGGSYDQGTNTIAFETEHFSKYALLEKALIRLGGADRFETSVKAARQYYPKADVAILAANTNDFADGLAASVLAGAIKAPVLLTQKGYIPQSVSNYLKEAGVKTVYVMGGPDVVAPAVEKALSGYKVERVYGDNREGTAVEIAKKVKALGKTLKDTAIIINGYAPADALAAGPVAAQGMPLLMVNKNNIPKVTKDALKEFGIKNIIVVGDTGVVSDNVFEQLKGLVSGSVERAGGCDRIATSVALANKLGLPNIVVVGYNGLPDAVAGGYIGALEEGAVIYSKADKLNDVSDEYIKSILKGDTRATILGDNGVVSRVIEDGLVGQLKEAEK